MRFLIVCVAGIILVACKTSKTDSVKNAEAVTAKSAYRNSIQTSVAEFLIKAADARMMDTREGEMAAERGTTPAVKEYGNLMIRDQAALLMKIRRLASARRITLPSDISDSRKDGLKTLEEKEAKDFDSKFTDMMIIDHERDVSQFKEAMKLKDKDVREFASLSLPILEKHLSGIKAIRDAR